MYLENVVFDALEPQRLGRFWEAAIAGERLTDEPDAFETRLAVDGGGPVLDLCFQRVTDSATQPARLRLAFPGGSKPAAEVTRLVELGARPLGGDRREVSWVALADPEGNPCRVHDDSAAYDGSGPIAALALDSADPARDVGFWSWLTGWHEVAGTSTPSLRHPSGRGPVLELRAEPLPKSAAKNRLHLDLRLDAGEGADDIEAEIAAREGRRLPAQWGELPWRSYTDPSGNEFCVLPASR